MWNAAQLRGSQREEIAALLRGKVDVFASSGPRALENKALLGAHVVHDLAHEPSRLGRVSNSFPYTFTVSGSLLKENPDLVTRLLLRVLEAADWAKTHHEEVVRITAYELGVAEEFVEQAFGPKLSQQLDVNLNAENIEALKLRKQFLLEHGFLKKDFDLNPWIDFNPLALAHRLRKERAGKTTHQAKTNSKELALATA